MTRSNFHIDLRQEHAEADRALTNVITIFVVVAFILGAGCLWYQWDRLNDQEMNSIRWEIRG